MESASLAVFLLYYTYCTATSSTHFFRNWEEQHIQPLGNNVSNDSIKHILIDQRILESGNGKLEDLSTPAVSVGSLRTSKAHFKVCRE